MPKVVTFTGPLTHACKHGYARVLLGDISDQLCDDYRLANTRTSVSAHLATTRERRDQIQDLNTRLQNFSGTGLLCERRWLTVDRQSLGVGWNLLATIDRLAKHVKYATQRVFSDRHCDRTTSVNGFDSARQTVGCAECKTSRPVVANVLLDFEHQSLALVVDFQTAVNQWKIVRRECDVDNRADNLDYFAFATLCHLRQAPIWYRPTLCSAGRISSIVVLYCQTGVSSFGKIATSTLHASDTAHDVEQLAGYGFLPCFVQIQGQILDQFVRVVCRVLHRDHAG